MDCYSTERHDRTLKCTSYKSGSRLPHPPFWCQMGYTVRTHDSTSNCLNYNVMFIGEINLPARMKTCKAFMPYHSCCFNVTDISLYKQPAPRPISIVTPHFLEVSGGTDGMGRLFLWLFNILPNDIFQKSMISSSSLYSLTFL